MPHHSAEDKVVEVLRQVGEEIATGSIVDELSGAYEASTVRGAISNLRKQGRIEKVKQGLYRLPTEGEVQQGRQRSNMSEHGDPIYDQPASAGDGTAPLSETPSGHMPPSQSLSSAGRDVFWMPVQGDSMGKAYRKHSLIPVVRFDDTATDIGTDDVYVIRLEGTVQIKRLQRLTGQRIRIISDNPAYPNEEIPLDDGVDFEILGRVLV